MDVRTQILEINKESIPLEEKNKKIQALLLSNTNIQKICENTYKKTECNHYTNKCMVYCEECDDFFNSFS